jgi:hypothetical protein
MPTNELWKDFTPLLAWCAPLRMYWRSVHQSRNVSDGGRAPDNTKAWTSSFGQQSSSRLSTAAWNNCPRLLLAIDQMSRHRFQSCRQPWKLFPRRAGLVAFTILFAHLLDQCMQLRSKNRAGGGGRKQEEERVRERWQEVSRCRVARCRCVCELISESTMGEKVSLTNQSSSWLYNRVLGLQ